MSFLEITIMANGENNSTTMVESDIGRLNPKTGFILCHVCQHDFCFKPSLNNKKFIISKNTMDLSFLEISYRFWRFQKVQMDRIVQRLIALNLSFLECMAFIAAQPHYDHKMVTWFSRQRAFLIRIYRCQILGGILCWRIPNGFDEDFFSGSFVASGVLKTV